MSQEILNKFLTEMGELLKSAKDFTVDQAPQVAKEILRYNLASSVAYFLLGVALLVAAAKTFKVLRKFQDDAGDYDVLPIFAWGAYILSIIAGVCMFFCNLSSILKITLAPRLYLIEYFAALVRSGGK